MEVTLGKVRLICVSREGFGIQLVELQAPVGLSPRLFIEYKNQPVRYTLRFTLLDLVLVQQFRTTLVVFCIVGGN